MGGVETALLVAAGGALGALSRWGCGALLERVTGAPMPWGTLAVNVLGCLALGVVVAGARDRWPALDPWRPLLATGFLGAFTTFSTFCGEGDEFLAGRRWGAASLYLLGSVALGLVAFRAGATLAARVPA